MKIGFVSSKPQKSFECLAERSKDAGYTIEHVPLRNMSLSYSGVCKFAEDCKNNFDVLHYYAGVADPIGQLFGEICDEIGLPVLNNRARIHPAVHDKMFQMLSFSKANLPVPKTEFGTAHTFESVKEIIGEPFIAKKSRGTHGTHVHLIKQKEEFDAINNKSQYLFQEYLPHKNDVRVLVLNSKAICGYKRIPASDEFRANLALGGSAAQLESDEVPIVFKLAEQAVQSVPLDLAGIDLIQSEYDNQYRLIEININPSWYGIADSTNTHFEDALLEAYQKLSES